METAPPSPEITTREGIVGMFDILGFQSHLRNNPEVSSKVALKILLNLEQDVSAAMKSRFSEDMHPVFEEIKYLVISDTILITLAYPDGDPPKYEKQIRWLTMLGSAANLYHHMFLHGLPVRGAIAFGKFVVEHNCFAGNAIIDAYSIEKTLEFAGVVLCDSSEAELARLDSPFTADGMHIFIKYLIPQKKDEKIKRNVVNPFLLYDHLKNVDLARVTSEAFFKHGKDIDERAMKKLENTVLFLRRAHASQYGFSD